MIDKTIVCVLGMHRSGTSILTRLLNILGVYLGPEERLLQPLADNPRGFWEHQLLQELNEEILTKAGGSWHDPPTLSSDWERRANLENFVMRAERVIHDDFTRAKIWGWKDPRTCLTLQFWQRLLPSMRYVICLRNPMDVARSLERRDGFSVEKGIYLWLTYLKAVLDHTAHQRRILVFHEELMEKWQFELQRLSEFLGMPERANRKDVQDKVKSFIDQKLWHHRSETLETVVDLNPRPLARALLMAQQTYDISKQHGLSRLGGMIESLEIALDVLRPVVRKQEAHNRQREQDDWAQKLCLVTQEIEALIPPNAMFILVDEARLGISGLLATRRVVPFPERDGQYGGRPANDETAIRQFERLRQTGATFIVFAWPAFWWLDHYSRLHQYLRSEFSCVLENDRLIAFDLQSRYSTLRLQTQEK